MACNIEQANNDIDRLLKSSISEDIKKELRTVKEQLAKAKKLKLEENIKSYNDSESIDSTKKDFRSEFKNKRPSAAKWADKEVSKFNVATQAISDGTNNSTAGFVKDFYGDKANTGKYTKDDVIYLSTNGNRTGRVIPVKNGVLQGAYKNIDKAIEAGAKFVADTSKHLASTGKYNVGEVELAEYLQSKGYTREDKDGYGLWSQDNSSIKNDNKPIEIDNSSNDRIDSLRKKIEKDYKDYNIYITNEKVFSVQQVLEQYKKDENIEKENAKLLKYIQDNVKFEMNYSKQLAYDFFTGESIAGLYDWKENVVTIADFEGLRADKEMMKMLSIEQVNQDDSVKDIDTASTQINMIISEINKRNIKFTTKLHESVHAAVFNYMRSDNGKEYSDEMTKLYNVVKESAKANPDMFTTNKSYWAKDVDEFLAEALSKPELIKDLMKIDVEGNLITAAKKSMFDKIIDIVVEALGLSKKEDKLNMHKYLLDSFKAAVEANKDGKEYTDLKAPEVEYQKDSKYPSTSKNKVKLNTTHGSESKKNIHHSLSGKIILANSGIGKSYAKRIYNNIVDGDDLFRDAANFILEKYNQSEYKIDSVSNMRDVFELWGEYSSDIDKVTEAKKRRDEVYRKYAEFAKESSKNGMTVLSSSAREPIISIADFAIVQNDAETIAKNRSSELRENKEEFSIKKAKEKIESFKTKVSGIKTINLYKDQYISEILEKGVTINDSESIDKKRYKTINEEDIMQAKDIMLKNKEECR